LQQHEHDAGKRPHEPIHCAVADVNETRIAWGHALTSPDVH